MRKRFFISFLSFLVLGLADASAQRTEFGLMGGGTTYFGDLNTNTSFKLTRPAISVYGRINVDSRIAFKLMASYASVAGSDAYSNNYYQLHRNLSFSSPILEAEGQVEFNFLDYSSTNPKFKYSPYFLFGLGLFNFNPSTSYQGANYDLRNMGTEGQGYPEYPEKKPYKLTAPFWTVGGGFKYRVSKNFSFFVEAANRKTFTDYLDDVGGVYPERLVLYNEGGPLAANLSDRSNEIGDISVGQADKFRADKKKDNYFFLWFGLILYHKQLQVPIFAGGQFLKYTVS